MDALFASKPAPTGFASATLFANTAPPVGASLLAKRPAQSTKIPRRPSPASPAMTTGELRRSCTQPA
ncbi:hypothetical protein FE275_00920 [Pseudomonas koreensis]|nr:hypothetical protein FE275_00920 [Pseudomonas koreensis]